MTYRISRNVRHRLIRWLARGERVDINRPQPPIWLATNSATNNYRFDGVEWFRV